MSGRILRALMQLFAICANTDKVSADERRIVENFLRQNISPSLVDEYLQLFDQNLQKLRDTDSQNKAIADNTKIRNRFSLNSAEILTICNEINQELNVKQKYIVLIRIIEFLYAINLDIDQQESEFLDTIHKTFKIGKVDYSNLVKLVLGEYESISHEVLKKYNKVFAKMVHTHPVKNDPDHDLLFYYSHDADLIVMKSINISDININNQPITGNAIQIIFLGSIIRSSRFKTIYFSEVHKLFVKASGDHSVTMEVKDVEYKFSDGTVGIRPFSFTENSGSLFGIMGNSGAGKSTLLSILNGTSKPSKGSVLINGKDIHNNNDNVLQLIGYIPQDDLLIGELTVFENLYFSAKLSIGKLKDISLRKKINKTLNDLGLYDIRNVKVGDSLNKFISGGQRKRLNIALELIREPKILLVDEPTSGLSSNDAENVMDLLREIADRGSIVMVVIHQPSSQIFKLFDTLSLFDKGGYNIYTGNPLDAINYFKKEAGFADFHESNCVSCGNVNPEIIFSIVESRVIDEYGRLTVQRKISAQQWNELFIQYKNNTAVEERVDIKHSKQEASKTKPGALFQFLIYFRRDIASKIKNTQYLGVNLLIAPVLSVILSLTLRYHSASEAYSYAKNNNITVFLFISVIVAFFLGLSISAEEIIKDKKILKRESLLQLSKHSYLLSKIVVLILISIIQIFCYVILSYFILDLNSFFYTLLLLLLTSISAVLIGLNLSAGFKNAITVYILIPFIVIPQMLLSGIMVRFDKLNTVITNNEVMPAVGNTMICRWSFEALAVNEFLSAAYNKKQYDFDSRISKSQYMVDYWSDFVRDSLMTSNHDVLVKNINLEAAALKLPAVNANDKNALLQKVEEIKDKHIDNYNSLREKSAQMLSADSVLNHKKKFTYNSTLADLLKNKEGTNKIIIKINKLIRLHEPIYNREPVTAMFNSQMYTYSRNVLGNKMHTTFTNILLLIIIIMISYVALYFNVIEKFLTLMNRIGARLGF